MAAAWQSALTLAASATEKVRISNLDPPLASVDETAPTRLLRVDLRDAKSYGSRWSAREADHYGSHEERSAQRLQVVGRF